MKVLKYISVCAAVILALTFFILGKEGGSGIALHRQYWRN
jgi:hypothetical protein